MALFANFGCGEINKGITGSRSGSLHCCTMDAPPMKYNLQWSRYNFIAVL
jgi:hypothetical protein